MSGLDALRERIDTQHGTKLAPSKKKEFVPLQLEDLGRGTVLAVDQSLGATGWVLVTSNGACTVQTAGSFSTDPGETKGHDQSLRRGVECFDTMQRIIDLAIHLDADRGGTGVTFVHETPPVGNRMQRPESSLLSAQALRIAAHLRGYGVEMLGAQPAKKLVCGNANATKPVAHAALAKYCGPWIGNYTLIKNEASRDALLIALLHLSKTKGRS